MKRDLRITDRVRRPPIAPIITGKRHGTVDGYDRWARVVVRWDDGTVEPIDDGDALEHVPPEDES